MGTVQWGQPRITVEKVLDTNPNVHLMNLEDALRCKRMDEAVQHLRYAWKVGKNDKEVKKECLEVLKELKEAGYAKDIHWEREDTLEVLIGIITVAILVVCWIILGIKKTIGVLLLMILVGPIVGDIIYGKPIRPIKQEDIRETIIFPFISCWLIWNINIATIFSVIATTILGIIAIKDKRIKKEDIRLGVLILVFELVLAVGVGWIIGWIGAKIFGVSVTGTVIKVLVCVTMYFLGLLYD